MEKLLPKHEKTMNVNFFLQSLVKIWSTKSNLKTPRFSIDHISILDSLVGWSKLNINLWKLNLNSCWQNITWRPTEKYQYLGIVLLFSITKHYQHSKQKKFLWLIFDSCDTKTWLIFKTSFYWFTCNHYTIIMSHTSIVVLNAP